MLTGGNACIVTDMLNQRGKIQIRPTHGLGVGVAHPMRLAPAQLYRPATVRLFLLCAGYVAIPYGDLPGLRISLSAPLMFLIALELFFRPAEPWLHRYRRWVLWGLAIWLGVFFSATLNGLRRGGMDVGAADAKEVFYYGYWLLLVFPVTVYLVSRLGLGRRTAQAMAVAVVLIALLRWVEALGWGKIGAWTSPRFFTQNAYGALFSTFTPMLVALLADSKTKRRWLVAVGILVIWSAAAINGSRGSWVALAAGAALFTILYMVSNPTRVRGLALVVLVCVAFIVVMQVMPERVVGAISERYATFQRLEEDRTFVTRRALVQKGLYLFRESPLIGVGPGRWQNEFAVIDLPLAFRGDLYDLNRHTSHNSYVSFLAENGLLGAIPYGMLFLYLAIKGLRAALHLARKGEVWALGFYVAFAAMSVHLYVLAGLTGTSTWMVYGLVAGMIERASDGLAREMTRP